MGTTAPAASPSAGPSAAGLARSVPVMIRIPAIGVSAPVMELGLNGDGSLEVPPLADLNLAGWYKYGPSPGQVGAAVIAGHIDSKAGEAVFFSIRNLKPGDRVEVALADGQTAVFAVTGVQQAPKSDFPTGSVYAPVPYAGLRLITCGGVFDPAAGSYESNVIVYARSV